MHWCGESLGLLQESNPSEKGKEITEEKIFCGSHRGDKTFLCLFTPKELVQLKRHAQLGKTDFRYKSLTNRIQTTTPLFVNRQSGDFGLTKNSLLWIPKRKLL